MGPYCPSIPSYDVAIGSDGTWFQLESDPVYITKARIDQLVDNAVCRGGIRAMPLPRLNSRSSYSRTVK